MIHYISKKIYRQFYRKSGGLKALAFLVHLKMLKPASVIKDWSYRELSRLTGLSPNTCKARVEFLKANGAIRTSTKNGHKYLHLIVLRASASTHTWNDKKGLHKSIRRRKKENLPIIGTGWNSVKEIELALMGTGINDEVRRKEFARQLVCLAHNPSPFVSDSRTKRAKKGCDKRGYGNSYTETGISYRRMMKWFHCGPKKIKDMITFGESTEMFVVERPGFVHVAYVHGRAKTLVKLFQYESHFTLFATANNIYYKPALIFRPWGTQR